MLNNMERFRDWLKQFPVVLRAAPFFVFVGLMALRPVLGDAGKYWLYLAQTLAGAGVLWAVRPLVSEMRWAWSWEALVVGAGVCVMWIGLDPWYPHLIAASDAKAVWDPFSFYAGNAGLAWFFVGVRLIGSSLVVPPLEEVFYRSLFYRYIVKKDFESVPLGHFAWAPFLIASLLFGFEHSQWLAGVVCGFAYQWLVIRKKRLGDAITAHAITNCLLALYVVWRGAWGFW
jgi:CAAX prenyl protease-like protein